MLAQGQKATNSLRLGTNIQMHNNTTSNCMHVIPKLAELEKKYAGRPFVVVGVHSAKWVQPPPVR